jgi:hypothetical protein
MPTRAPNGYADRLKARLGCGAAPAATDLVLQRVWLLSDSGFTCGRGGSRDAGGRQMNLQRCELALFGLACFVLGFACPLLLVEPDGSIGAGMALCGIVAGVQWSLIRGDRG